MGIGLGEFRVVGLLMGEAEGLSQNELCSRLGISAPSLSVAVRALEQRGTVTRRADSDDGRIKRVVLRPDADIRRVQRMLERLQRRVTRSLSAEDVATTLRVLHHIADELEAEATR